MGLNFNKVLISFIVVLMLAACSQSSAVEVGSSAPDFSLTSVDGQKTSLSDFKGKAVILNFFTNWCPPCKAEIPDFIELQKQYGDKGFTFVGVSLVGLQESREFVGQMKINYPVLVDDGKAGALYGPVRAIPTTFVINKDMKIVKMYVGARSKETF